MQIFDVLGAATPSLFCTLQLTIWLLVCSLVCCSQLEILLSGKKKMIRKGKKRRTRRKSPFSCPLQGTPQQIISLHLTSVPLHHLLSHRATLFPPSLPSINLLFAPPHHPPPTGLLPAVATFLRTDSPSYACNMCKPSRFDLRDFISKTSTPSHDPSRSLPKEEFTLISAVSAPASCLHLGVSSLDSTLVCAPFILFLSILLVDSARFAPSDVLSKLSLAERFKKFLPLLDVDATRPRCSTWVPFMRLEFALPCLCFPRSETRADKRHSQPSLEKM